MGFLPRAANEGDRGKSCVLLIDRYTQEARLIVRFAMLP